MNSDRCATRTHAHTCACARRIDEHNRCVHTCTSCDVHTRVARVLRVRLSFTCQRSACLMYDRYINRAHSVSTRRVACQHKISVNIKFYPMKCDEITVTIIIVPCNRRATPLADVPYANAVPRANDDNLCPCRARPYSHHAKRELQSARLMAPLFHPKKKGPEGPISNPKPMRQHQSSQSFIALLE